MVLTGLQAPVSGDGGLHVEVARQFGFTRTTAGRMLSDYLERFDDDEPIPSSGFNAWVEAMDDRGSDDEASAK